MERKTREKYECGGCGQNFDKYFPPYLEHDKKIVAKKLHKCVEDLTDNEFVENSTMVCDQCGYHILENQPELVKKYLSQMVCTAKPSTKEGIITSIKEILTILQN